MEVEIVGLSLGSLAGLRCFWGFRCVGELEVICMHLTSGAVQCRVLESLVYEWRSRRALGDSSPADETRNRRNIDVLGRE